MNLPKLTPRQQELVKLIYRYRFITRRQLQILLNHTDKRRVSAWLKELREQQFLDWIYSPNDPYERSTPAVYFIGINGIRFLRKAGGCPENELRKRYKDATRQQDFIGRCLLLVDCAIHLEGRNKGEDALGYSYALESDYSSPDNDNGLLSESEFIHPDLAFTKQTATKKGSINQAYFLQFFELTTPRYMLKKKLRSYVEYFDSSESEEWCERTQQDDLPIILIACPTLPELIYAKRYARMQLEEQGLDDREDVYIRFTTLAQVKRQGLTSAIWEDI